MAGKYDHLFVTEMKSCDEDMVYEGEETSEENLPNIGQGFAMMRSKDVPESRIYMTHVWINENDTRQTWVHEHVHDYDEILSWRGNDRDNPHDLGGEIFMTIEGEEHRITTTGSVYIPAGTKHCPLGFGRIERPFTFSALMLDGDYTGRRS
ncbi:hypothetical protein [Pseudonocardia acaciae]|uniref:hypothetical protein n=1 Tax=Pseudonocardia acaciae TaxID=551276 RepID=UPI00048E2D45|nr:hypothetical protein [Pseudonocardia acaciae]